MLKDSNRSKPKEKDVPHGNEDRALNKLAATEHEILIIVILGHHGLIGNHANGLYNEKAKAEKANRVCFVTFDHHAVFFIAGCIRYAVLIITLFGWCG